MSKHFKEIMNDITTFILDVDGVLTDGSVHVAQDGNLLRVMSIRDGYAIKAAIEHGYNVFIISGGNNEGVRIRLQNLGVKDIHMSVSNKVEVFDQLLAKYNLNAENVMYMGDDIPDYHVMQKAALPTCPQDAVPEVKSVAKYISHVNGGKGAVREVIEQVMKTQQKWFQHFDAKYD
ncbi:MULTISPECIES: KdsC family phosphatase [Myroides]|uniref:HAD hydrolase family protein n=1 Tax=Myroides albus TaxID=2562892 RepID=A0A6I3LKY8_9FLAO|nr:MULTISPECIES: HAD-IIIA family hydrolase [Myroides]MTG97161.1 HAD hydrolase family protein [Myroides albus]MVX35158.1 HAD hydrolase family protein [Myroides sp. LoEW2-1]UVD78903.1 HAD-IIIA family hydrolase [Myroides albus]